MHPKGLSIFTVFYNATNQALVRGTVFLQYFVVPMVCFRDLPEYYVAGWKEQIANNQQPNGCRKNY
jgi:hypothetical protein